MLRKAGLRARKVMALIRCSPGQQGVRRPSCDGPIATGNFAAGKLPFGPIELMACPLLLLVGSAVMTK